MNELDMKKFLKKIHDDSEFYLNHFLKIRTKDGELVNFKMNAGQRKSDALIRKQQALGKPVRVIWLKARQLGISTYCEGKIFHNTANNPLRNSMIIAHEDKATQNLFNMSKLFYDELPPIIKPMKKYSNESALSFENPTNDDLEKYKNPGLRSKITVATAKNVDTGRSATIHNLHASEVAFWDNAETLMTGLLQCVPDTSNSMVFIESTANGVGGWFYDFWKKSERGETDYIPIFLAWFDNPEYTKVFESKAQRQQFIEEINKVNIDQNGEQIRTEEWHLRDKFGLTYEQLHWRTWAIANKCFGDIEKFRQEYPSTPDEAFIVSGRPQFSINALREYQNNQRPPIWRGYLQENGGKIQRIADDKGYLHIWKFPVPDQFYVIGADVAEGLATGDYSVAVVMDEQLDIVAAWHGHIDPDLFGYELVKLGLTYNEAYVGPESNNHGLTTIRAMQRKDYYNLYYQKTYDKISDKVNQKVGWNTNNRTKPLMINTLSEYIREKWVGMPWDILISECFTYVKDEDGKTNAQAGSHDDTVMALAITLMLMLEGRGENYTPEIPKENGSQSYFDGDDGDYGKEELCIDNSGEEEYSI
jgi:hypothetical protein